MSSLSLDDVRRVAMLARLGMSDDELAEMQEKLSSILDHIEVLNELDTDHIDPTAQVVATENVWREDVAGESFSQETALKNAADSRDGFFAVSAVMGGDEGASA